MSYKYETHLHTLQGSACASSSANEYVKAYYDAGYSGFFVTDHFFGGNTAVPKDKDWKTRVHLYCSGYESALVTAEKFNEENDLTGTDKEFKVFFGIEQTFDGDDYLIYGLTKEWLLDHPEIEKMRHQQLFELLNSVGGLVIQAHPFRFRGYQQAMHIHPRDVHGVEIYNAGNKPEENYLAEIYANQYNFPMTSGSDIHTINTLVLHSDLPCGGMEFDTPLKDVFDYATRIKTKSYRLIKPEIKI